jgi:flagellar protein FliS
MQASNPWKSYRQIATQTAPPGQLVLMLYEGALRFLQSALNGFAITDPAESNMAVHNNLHRAQEIIHELNLALNMEQGGEFASTLRRLYDYFDRRILESNLQKKREGIDEVVRHLTVLRDAWAAMLVNQTQPASLPTAISALATA